MTVKKLAQHRSNTTSKTVPSSQSKKAEQMVSALDFW